MNDKQLRIGDQFYAIHLLKEELIEKFAQISGDTNPVHLDEEYAKTTRFGGRVVHGLLIGSFISIYISICII
jgi:3-hydroxybutyryl-CoA dehydratase